MSGKKHIDDILNAALDELDDDSDDSCVDSMDQPKTITSGGSTDTSTVTGTSIRTTTTTGTRQVHNSQNEKPRPFFGPPRPPQKDDEAAMSAEEKAVMDMMRQMENLFPSNDFGKDDNNNNNNHNHNHNNNHNLANNQGHKQTLPKAKEGKGRGTAAGAQETGMDDAVSQLLRELSKNEEGNQGNFQDFGDEMMEEMQKEWESTMKGAAAGPSSFSGEDQDGMENVVDGMMKQLLSKEFMYEPMRDISLRFPKWLAENKEKLSSDDYDK